ncbi:MAG: cupin [Gulosibacter sp.]|uniref:cupin n=1 Tax=Gulosibacter sp. TaxID=2817531 RepID=UPI003F8F8D2A
MLTNAFDHEGSSSEIQLENEHFRVTKWTIEPGGHIPLHRHEHPYTVVPLVTATMHAVNADGTEIVADLAEGSSYARAEGTEHRVENRNSEGSIVFVEVEAL